MMSIWSDTWASLREDLGLGRWGTGKDSNEISALVKYLLLNLRILKDQRIVDKFTTADIQSPDTLSTRLCCKN